MKNSNLFISLILLFSLISFGQPKTSPAKIIVTGNVIENSTKTPLEYATITLKDNSSSKIFGGITDKKGNFSVEAVTGTYDIVIEFISYKSNQIYQKKLTANTNLGKINLEEDFTQLNEVVVRNERTTVEIKLDKKVYNVGKDLMVKGGTVSDILDNIPSVSVDVEGNVSLRGNENVKILIDGRPSNAINITEALRLIPADAIDKVEVITNPSARYDAEGGAGLLNIILKKGKNQGLNGTIIGTTGYPENNGISANINYKSKKYNLFTTQGYNSRNSPGNALTDSRYLNPDNSTRNYMNEKRNNDRFSNSYSSILGIEVYLNEKTSWTNAINYRNSKGNNRDDVDQFYYDVNNVFEYTRNRLNEEDGKSRNIEYTSNFLKNFQKDGHKLTVDLSISENTDDNTAFITDTNTLNSTVVIDNTINNQDQNRVLIQSDYVLPFGKGSQFEAGYRGDFFETVSDYNANRNGVPIEEFTNTLEYKEKVNAVYSQYGFKKNKSSVLLGLRFEDSNIDVNQLATNDYNNKRYNNFFPSAFYTYEISDESSASVSYSRRIQRPRGRLLNPFNNLSSNVNIFVGNPDLDPAYTDAIDFGYIKRWSKLTFNTSLYVNMTSDVFQWVREETNQEDNDIPIIITTPINLATELRSGFEFTLNYSPYKWWKLNGNFNFFYINTDGDYTYTDFNGNEVYQNFDNIATSWSARITSKVTLPYKIDWQTNMSYNGEQKNAQGRSLGIFGMNLAFSKDVMKDKGTIAFNISDVFNSRKRIVENYLVGVVDAYAENQWRVRQFTLSFTYRFNKQKNERERRPRTQQEEGGDYPGR
jgi:outer membrane receptor for ferrienterochelin and colicins